jgi:hypothetical protein
VRYMDASLREAAKAAELRAEWCRRRVSALQAGARPQADDARQAKLALAAAQRREALARQRLDARRQRQVRRMEADDGGWILPPTPRSAAPVSAASMQQVVREAGLSIADVHCYYVSLGGCHSSFDLDAYLHGLADLPPQQQLVLSQAVWELREWPPR